MNHQQSFKVEKWITIMILCIGSMSCSAVQDSLTQNEKEKIAEEIRKTLFDYHDDIRENGLMAEFKYLDPTNEFFWVPPSYTSPINFDSVAHILKLQSSMFNKIDNHWEKLRIIPYSKTIAVYTGTVHCLVMDKNMHSDSFQLIETGVVIKRKDGWKLLNGQTAVIE